MSDHDDERSAEVVGYDQAIELVRKMQAIWPTPTWPTATTELWIEELERTKRSYAEPVLRALQLNCKRRPAFAEFHEACQALWRDTQLGASSSSHLRAVPALESGDRWVTSLDEHRAMAQAAKDELARHKPVEPAVQQPKRRYSAPEMYEPQPVPVGEAIADVLNDVSGIAEELSPSVPVDDDEPF